MEEVPLEIVEDETKFRLWVATTLTEVKVRLCSLDDDKKELSKRVATLETRVSKIDRKMWWAAGGGAVLLFLLQSVIVVVFGVKW